MNERVHRLRRESLDAVETLSIERALLWTEFCRDNEGRWPAPLMRARAFHHLCSRKRIYIGDGELIVGERGPFPKATSTYPEINCHTVEDLDHATGADRGLQRHGVQTVALGQKVHRTVHVGAGVGTEGQSTFPETVVFEPRNGLDFRWRGAWVYGHVGGHGVG